MLGCLWNNEDVLIAGAYSSRSIVMRLLFASREVNCNSMGLILDARGPNFFESIAYGKAEEPTGCQSSHSRPSSLKVLF